MKIKFFLGCCMVALIVFFVPVYADPITLTVTRVNITQNGVPITSAIDYTMTCYGHSFYEGNPSWMKEHQITKILNISGTDDFEYSYSAHCDPGRCDIYEIYDTWTMKMSHCDIKGTYQGRPFVIRNFSKDPLPPNCINMHIEKWNNGFRYCMEEQCHKTLDPTEARGSSRYCELNFDLSESIDPSVDVSADNSGMQLSPALSGFIPSPSSTIQIPSVQTQDVTVQPSLAPIRGPVESLYCSILKFFNAEC